MPKATRAGGGTQPVAKRDQASIDIQDGAPDIALPLRHDLTHSPKISACPICQRAKARNKPHKSHAAAAEGGATFGAPITSDLAVLGNPGEASRNSDTPALFVPRSGPAATHHRRSLKVGLMYFACEIATFNRDCTDGSRGLMATACDLSWGTRAKVE